MRRTYKSLGVLMVLLASLAIVPASLAASPGQTVNPAAAHTVHAPKHATSRMTRSQKAKTARSAKAEKLAKSETSAKPNHAKRSISKALTGLTGTEARATSAVSTVPAAAGAALTSVATPSAGATSPAASAAVSSAASDSAAVTSQTATTPATTTLAAAPTSPAKSSSGTTSSSAEPVLGTFDISTPAQASAWKSAGGNAVIIPIFWQAAQPTQGGPVSLAGAGNSGDNVITEVQTAHQDGLSVYLELDLQYPPQWVLNTVPQFVDQGGTSWSQPTNPGADVRDWIWTATGRQAVSSFVAGALADLEPVLGDVAGMRSGGGVYGELDFPNDGSTVNGEPSFWGYDAAAQTGAGLASGESATPLPGYVYGSGTSAQDTEWANWYLGSLASWIKWYTQLLRSDGWTGPTYVLSPSFGMRTNMTPYSTPYEQQLAYGTDWDVMMDSYDQVPNVWPWSTWADDTEPYWHTGDTVDSDAAAWRKLLELAQARGLASHIMGENTGGGGAPAIHQLMSGALASGYTGIFYLDYPTLTSEGLTPYLVSQFDTYAPAGS